MAASGFTNAKLSSGLPAPRLLEGSFSSSEGVVSALTDEALFEVCGVRIAFAGRAGGVSKAHCSSLNVSEAVEDEPQAVAANRRILLKALGAAGCASQLVVCKQVHGCDIVSVGQDVASAQSAALAGADGIICARSHVPAMIYTADCTPVVLVAPTGAFAVLHAGRAGSLLNIAGKGLTQLVKQEGVRPAECNCYIGPHIGGCCYEVGQDKVDEFVDAFGPQCDAGDARLDLTAANIAALTAAGADPRRIVDSGVCTACRTDAYFSYRAEGGKTGRQATVACRFDS